MLAEALSSSWRMLSRSHCSHPAALAARSASVTAAARPLSNTLRTSFRVAAAPGGPGSTSTVAPSPPNTRANCAAAGPEASIGVRSPLPGTGDISATSAKATPPPSARPARRTFASADAVFRSA